MKDKRNNSKISAPQAVGLVHRERLFEVLDKGFDKKALWIMGHGGSGKTNLAVTYLNARNIPHIWYGMDGGDADIASFFYYLGLSIKKAVPRFRNPMPILTPEHFPTIRIFARQYFEEMFRRIKQPFAVVFDNAHEVSELSLIHEILATGIDEVPKGISVIIVSRKAPPSQYSRLRVNGNLKTIGWSDLRLTSEESRQIVKTKAGKSFSDDDLNLIYQRTDGWVAGLVLLVESAGKSGLDRHDLDRLTPDAIFPYFASEIFYKTEIDTQTFLMKTSFLASMTAGMALCLTENQSAEKILYDLNRSNYFTELRLEKDPVFLYHSLFRTFLQSKAMESFSEAALDNIRQKSADLLLESGHVEEAVLLLIESGNYSRLTQIIIEHAPSLLAQGRVMALSAWLSNIPDQLFQDNPWLCYWKGITLFPNEYKESRVLFEKAFRLFNEQSVDDGAFLAWSGVVDTHVFEFKNFRLIDTWIEWLDEKIGDHYVFSSPAIEACVLSSRVGALVWCRPDHPQMEASIQKTLLFYQSKKDIVISHQIFFTAIVYYTWLGKFNHVRLTLEELKKRAESRFAAPLVKINLKMMEASCAVTCAEKFENIIRNVNEGLALSNESGIHLVDFLIVAQEGYGMLIHGDQCLTEDFIKKIESTIDSDRPLTYCVYYDLMAFHCLYTGKPNQALQYVEKELSVTLESGLMVPEALISLIMTQIDLEFGDHQKALDHIEKAEDIFTKIGGLFFRCTCWVLRAYIHMMKGDDREAIPWLEKAFLTMKKEAYAGFPYLWRKKVLCRLYEKALNEGIEVDFVQGLVLKQKIIPTAPPLEIEHWPWPIKIFTLGRFSLVIDGKPISETGKIQKKPLLLLKALITSGGRDIKEETLSDLIWPESEGDAGHNAFTTNIVRLRKLLRHENAVIWEKGKVSLNSRLCWVDCWAFERLCGQTGILADKIMKGLEDHFKLKQAADKNEKLYSGSFLRSEIDVPWFQFFRERLRKKYLQFIRNTAFALSHAGDDEAAITYYLKGIESEPLAEELYQMLITAYLRQNRLAEAFLTFNQCKQNLDTHFLPLSPATRALRMKIHKN